MRNIKMIKYHINLTPDDNGTFLVTCPDLPEVTSFGESEADALSHAADAVAEAIAARLATFEAIPQPTATAGEPQVALDSQMTLKVLLKWALDDARVSRAELARRLGVHRPSVDRLFDPHHGTRLDQYDAAFRVLGKAVSIDLAVAA